MPAADDWLPSDDDLVDLVDPREEEECPLCFHGASNHSETGCDVPGCTCVGP